MPQQNTSPAASGLIDRYVEDLAQGHLLPTEQVAGVLGVQEPTLEHVARLAYPLSQRDHAMQFLLRDLVLAVKRKAGSRGLEAALRELAGAAAAGPGLLLELASEGGTAPDREAA